MSDRNRKSPRASRYDYTSPGGYFITICTKDRAHYFGEIVVGADHQSAYMELNMLGQFADSEIARLSKRKTVDIHEWIVMPNHIHILLIMNERLSIDTQQKGDLINRPYPGPTLSSIVKLFKGNISKFANNNDIVFAWQRSYHDHIIRNENEYERIKYYIQTNPENRGKDKFYA